MTPKEIIKKIIPDFLIGWYHLCLSFLGAIFYRFPSRKITVIGVTGTNGKSTVVELIASILEGAGYKVAALSSIKFKIDDKEFVLKPMNCPGHILIYKSKMRSYRDLPLRFFELGTVYRHEKTGVLHGLLRVRGFTQDDAHIFCLPEQLKEEIKAIIDFVFETMKVFGFNEVSIELSTRPEKFIGTEEDWQRATSALEDSLKEKGLEFDINIGEGAFYGPKIDIKLKDALKRKWQCATIQCDFTLAQRFKLVYVDSDGKAKQPIMLHRVILGSLERFMGALIEHYGAALPLWLSPLQVSVIPIKTDLAEYANSVIKKLEDNCIRSKLDDRNETLDKRIREAELEKVPYILVVGQREVKDNSVAVRKRGQGDLGSKKLEEFINQIKEEIDRKGEVPRF